MAADERPELAIKGVDTSDLSPEQLDELAEMSEAARVAAVKVRQKYIDKLKDGSNYYNAEHVAKMPPEWVGSARLVHTFAKELFDRQIIMQGLLTGDLDGAIIGMISAASHQAFWAGYYYRQNVEMRTKTRHQFESLMAGIQLDVTDPADQPEEEQKDGSSNDGEDGSAQD